MVTAGANMAFMHAVLATTTPGDEVILPVPFYFNHEMAIEMAGCRPCRVPTDDRYQLRARRHPRARSRPRTRADRHRSRRTIRAARCSSEASLRGRERRCAASAACITSADEPYEYFTYGSARHVSPGSFADAADHTISMYSLSKAYGFAGWRIGYMVYPEHLASAMMKSQDTILICPPIASQVAARRRRSRSAARYCEPHVRELASIRDIVVDGAVGAGAARDGAGRRRRVLLPAEGRTRPSIRSRSPSG